MIVATLLIAVYVVWSARSLRPAWRAAYGETLNFSAGDEVCTAAFALSVWYLAAKLAGWS